MPSPPFSRYLVPPRDKFQITHSLIKRKLIPRDTHSTIILSATFFFLFLFKNAKTCTFSCGATAQRGHGLLIRDVSRSHSDTPQSVGLLWTRDQPCRDLYFTKHNTTDTHAHGGIRSHNPCKKAAADTRLRTHGHRFQ